MSEAQTPDNEGGLTRTEYARLFIASVLSMLMTLVFNGTLYLAYDGIFDWSRDVSTATSITLAIACLVIARAARRVGCVRLVSARAVRRVGCVRLVIARDARRRIESHRTSL